MTQRAAIVRRILMRLRSDFEHRGWKSSDGPKDMLVMRRYPAPGIEHKLMVHEPLGSSELPRTDVLGLACSVNVYFEPLETLICKVFGYDPETYGKLSGSLELCRLAPKDSCYLSSVHLVDPSSETSLKRLLGDYDNYLEPVRSRLNDLSVFLEESYQPPSIGQWAWKMRRAAYLYLHGSRPRAALYLENLEREADETLKALGPAQAEEVPGVFGSVANAVEAGKRKSAAEAKRIAGTLRAWVLENGPGELP